MKAGRAFTLAELLIVIGIMMILVVGSFGVLQMISEQAGPDASLAAIQAMAYAARDYAATNGVLARVAFEQPAGGGAKQGTVMSLEYLPAGATNWANAVPVIGRSEVPIGDRLYVFKDVTVPAAPSGTGESVQQAWKNYEQDVLARLTQVASGNIRSSYKFYLVFGPTGMVDTSGDSDTVRDGLLTIVEVAADGQALSYAFYPLNANNGVQLVFE
jgi:type II secretory pathway pseudopilin PulG